MDYYVEGSEQTEVQAVEKIMKNMFLEHIFEGTGMLKFKFMLLPSLFDFSLARVCV